MPNMNEQQKSQIICAPYPERKPGETDSEYNKRLEEFFQKQKETNPDNPSPNREKPPFMWPADRQELAAYLKAHPDTKWHISGSAAGMKEMLDDVKKLGMNTDNIESINMRCRDKDQMKMAMSDLKDLNLLGALKNAHLEDENINLSGKGLQKEIEKKFPYLKRPNPYD